MEEAVENEVAVGTEVEIKDPKAVLSALDRAKNDAKKFRTEKEALEKQLEDINNKSQAVSKLLLEEKIKQDMSKKGFINPERYMKYINLNNLTLNENYEIEGLDDQFNQLKSDFPEIFDAKIRVGGQADSAASSPANVSVSASELQAKYLLNR